MRSTAARKPRTSNIGIIDAAGREIEPDAAEARGLHGVEIGFAGLVVDHGHTARGRAARLHAEQRRRIVGSIDARRHDHHALDVQRLVQRAHLFGRGKLRRVDAPRIEREFFGIGVDVGVAIGGAGRHVEIHGGRGLRGFGVGVLVVHRYSGRDRGKQNLASVEHGRLSPQWRVVDLVVDVPSRMPRVRSRVLVRKLNASAPPRKGDLSDIHAPSARHTSVTRSAIGLAPSRRRTGQGSAATHVSCLARLRPSRVPSS
jgi:hypothetical protein